MLEITFTFTDLELYKGTYAIARSHPTMRKYRVIGIISVIASLLILFTDIAHAILLAIIFLVSGLCLTFIGEINSKLVAKKYAETKAQITEPVTYIFTEKSYQLTGDSFSTRMDYNKLFEVKEVSAFVLLRVTEHGSAHTLPRRAFSDDQFAHFKSLIRSVPNLRSTFNE